jgi:hypothetical protein
MNKKLGVLIFTALLLTVCMTALTACGGGEMTGIKEIYILKAGQSDYDFLKGVGGGKNAAVDVSEVDFDNAGEYPITFRSGSAAVSSVVKVYAKPEIFGEDL